MNLDFLYQDYDVRRTELKRLGNKLSHYTNFENARNILNGQTLWLKSADQQNDKYELKYGMSLIKEYSNSKADIIGVISAQSGVDFLNLLTFKNETFWNRILTDTFIASFIVHTSDDSVTGRADMWERYAQPEGIAFVLNAEFLDYNDDVLGLYPLPVRYFTQEKLNEYLDSIVGQMFAVKNNQVVFREKLEIAVQLVCLIASIKRWAYRAEDEWRLIANSEIEKLGSHLSQKKIPKRIELDLSGKSGSRFSVNNSLEQILIGPGPNQSANSQIIKQDLCSLNLSHIPVILSSI